MVKFLVIRFSSIGDIVLTSPIVRVIKQQIPEAEVHFLTKKQFAFIAENNPNIDKVHTLKDKWNELVLELKDEFYDHIIDLHNNLRTRRLKSALSIPSFTFDKLNFKKWLLVNFKINQLPNQHIVDRYMATLSVFDVTNDNKGLDYFIPENDRYDIKGLNNVDKNYIAFVLGATYFTKQIPNALVIKIIDSIGKMVVLLGGPDDIEKANEVEKASNSKVINLCGKINLNQSASVIEQSAIVITSDTGLMHIAAAFNKPIISLWGNTVPEFGMSPYLPKPKSAIFENKDLKCRPCSKIGFNECPKKHFDCMNTLDPEQISQYIKSLDVL